MYRQSGTWLDEGCWKTYTFVCFDGKKYYCRYRLMKKKNTQNYVFINEAKSWYEAQSYCRKHHTDLASVRNQIENQQISSAGITVERFWIGLFNDSWEWSDQSSSSFRYWNPSQPDNNDLTKCAAASVKDQGQWEDIRCEEQHPFFCYESEFVNKNVSMYQRFL
uniref:C-type lectin domain-containing protein n=1 Tax=Astyanax mexicanus TaxID=7994 RepID=A0A3B1J178_ASTMX